MARTALLNKRGTSLVELLIAVAILAVVATALMKSSILVLQKNVQNEIRDEAVRIAEQRMNEIRTGPGGFDGANGGVDLVAGNRNELITVTFPAIRRSIRNGQVDFTVTKSIVALDGDGLSANTKQVTVTVDWLLRGQQNSHAVMSIARRYGQ